MAKKFTAGRRLINSAKAASRKIKKDNINHPAYYGGKDNPYETIKVMKARLTREEFIGAMKFNVYKYNDRALMKDDELENYQKAQFYQNYLVDYLKNA